MSNRIYLLCFSSGVILHRFFPSLPENGWLASGLILVLSFECIFRRKKYQYITIGLTLFLAGLLWANFIARDVLSHSLSPDLEKKDVVVQGKVLGVPVQQETVTQFDFQIESLEFNGQFYPHPKKVRLKSYYVIDGFGIDQTWRLTVRLKRASGLQNPGTQFDYETWLFSNRIMATGYVREDRSNHRMDDPSFEFSFLALRQQFNDYLIKHFSNSTESAILSALLVGLRSEMPQSAWRTFRQTGTIHLVAISGLHISFVAGIVIWLASGLLRLTALNQSRLSSRDFGFVCGVGVAVLYAFLAGMTIPTRRALVMVVVLGTAYFYRRNSSIVDS